MDAKDYKDTDIDLLSRTSSMKELDEIWGNDSALSEFNENAEITDQQDFFANFNIANEKIDLRQCLMLSKLAIVNQPYNNEIKYSCVKYLFQQLLHGSIVDKDQAFECAVALLEAAKDQGNDKAVVLYSYTSQWFAEGCDQGSIALINHAINDLENNKDEQRARGFNIG